jgi:hypothetical protein
MARLGSRVAIFAAALALGGCWEHWGADLGVIIGVLI